MKILQGAKHALQYKVNRESRRELPKIKTESGQAS